MIYVVRFSYPFILLLFVVIKCSVIGILKYYIIITDQFFIVIFIAFLIFIASIDRNGLFCSSTSVIDSLNNPTPFCTLSGLIKSFHIRIIYIGAVFHYVIINFTLWWFFHVIIFYKVVFAFHANRMEKIGRNKYTLAVMIFLGISKIIIMDFY